MKRTIVFVIVILIMLIGCSDDDTGQNPVSGADFTGEPLLWFNSDKANGCFQTAINAAVPGSSSEELSVQIISDSDPTGIEHTLFKQSNGLYMGYLSFSTVDSGEYVVNNSISYNRIRVTDGDTVTVSAVLNGVQCCDQLLWKRYSILPTVKFVLTNYSGYRDQAIVSVTDYNHCSTTMRIHIISDSDPSGILIDIPKNYGYWYSTVSLPVGFTSGSSEGNKIKVSDGDRFTVSYTGVYGQTVSDTAVWRAQ